MEAEKSILFRKNSDISLVATVFAVAFTYPLWNVERNLAYE